MAYYDNFFSALTHIEVDKDLLRQIVQGPTDTHVQTESGLVPTLATALDDIGGTVTDEARAARDKAEEWAENPEDDEVEPGQFSALHHQLKAQESAGTAATHETAAQTARDKAEAWADEDEDVVVDTESGRDQFSARHWYEKAFDEAQTVFDDVEYVDSLFSLAGETPARTRITRGFYSDRPNEGMAFYRFDENIAQSEADGIFLVDDTQMGNWDGTADDTPNGVQSMINAQGDGTGTGLWRMEIFFGWVTAQQCGLVGDDVFNNMRYEPEKPDNQENPGNPDGIRILEHAMERCAANRVTLWVPKEIRYRTTRPARVPSYLRLRSNGALIENMYSRSSGDIAFQSSTLMFGNIRPAGYRLGSAAGTLLPYIDIDGSSMAVGAQGLTTTGDPHGLSEGDFVVVASQDQWTHPNDQVRPTYLQYNIVEEVTGTNSARLRYPADFDFSGGNGRFTRLNGKGPDFYGHMTYACREVDVEGLRLRSVGYNGMGGTGGCFESRIHLKELTGENGQTCNALVHTLFESDVVKFWRKGFEADDSHHSRFIINSQVYEPGSGATSDSRLWGIFNGYSNYYYWKYMNVGRWAFALPNSPGGPFPRNIFSLGGKANHLRIDYFVSPAQQRSDVSTSTLLNFTGTSYQNGVPDQDENNIAEFGDVDAGQFDKLIVFGGDVQNDPTLEDPDPADVQGSLNCKLIRGNFNVPLDPTGQQHAVRISGEGHYVGRDVRFLQPGNVTLTDNSDACQVYCRIDGEANVGPESGQHIIDVVTPASFQISRGWQEYIRHARLAINNAADNDSYDLVESSEIPAGFYGPATGEQGSLVVTIPGNHNNTNTRVQLQAISGGNAENVFNPVIVGPSGTGPWLLRARLNINPGGCNGIIEWSDNNGYQFEHITFDHSAGGSTFQNNGVQFRLRGNKTNGNGLDPNFTRFDNSELRVYIP